MSERKNIRIPEMYDISKGADIVIIGAGMTGAPLAFFAQHLLGSNSRVVGIESNPQVGQGSNTASLEQGRCGWADESVCEMMKISRDVFSRPQDFGLKITSDELGYSERPYLWAANLEEEVKTYQKLAQELQKRGVHAEYLDIRSLTQICPWLVGTSVVGGMMDYSGFKVDSQKVAQVFAESTQNADFFIDTLAVAIILEHGKVSGVKTSRGFIPTERVIVAAGSATRNLVETVDGLSVPIISFPRFSYKSQGRHQLLSNKDPFIIVPRTKAHFRPEGNGILGGYSHEVKPVDRPNSVYPDINYNFKDLFLKALWQGLNPEGEQDSNNVRSDDLELLASTFSTQAPFGRGTVLGGYYVHRANAINDDRPLITWLTSGIGVITAEQGHGVMGGPSSGKIGADIFFGGNPLIEAKNFSLYPPPSQATSLAI